jgi:hypothetical protein
VHVHYRPQLACRRLQRREHAHLPAVDRVQDERRRLLRALCVLQVAQQVFLLLLRVVRPLRVVEQPRLDVLRVPPQ